MTSGAPDRRAGDADFARWREHVDARLSAQDAALKEILDTVKPVRDAISASRMGVTALRWLVAVCAGVTAIWAALGHVPKP